MSPPEGEDVRIRAAIGGDLAALTELLRGYGPRLREQLSIDKRWQSVLDPDDVLQVTYLEAYQKVGTFLPGGPNAFYGWLKRIAENNLRDAIKGLEAAKRPPPALAMNMPTSDQSVVALFDILGVSSSTPSRVAAVGELNTALGAALSALPADYATVIREYDLAGREIGAIAAGMKRTPGAVHMLRARAHDRLRDLLGSGSKFFSNTA